VLINALNPNALPVQHSQPASKSVWRPAHHVSITTYKVALPASSGFIWWCLNAKMKARYAVNYEFQICSKGKKLLIIESKIKFIANIRKVSLW